MGFQLQTTNTMAIKLLVTYSKKLGLPGFSSHQFSVSVETELVTADDIAGESQRLYETLQANVDQQLLRTGFVPPKEYGLESHEPGNWQQGQAWNCSEKQRDLILRLVEEHQLDKADIEALSVTRFGKGVRLLSKVEASGLIEELLTTHCGLPQEGMRRGGSAPSTAREGRAA